MIRLRSWAVVLALAFLAASPLCAQSKKVKQIVPGVWLRTGEPLVLPNGMEIAENLGIVEMKDYLVVIEAGTANSARATLADCKALSAKPVKYVFVTHYHFDHAEGTSVWTSAGATTMAFSPVADELKSSNSKSDTPIKLISGDSYILNDGMRRLEFHHYGWAHTKGDGVAYLPKEKVLFAGDVVLNQPLNYLADSDLRNWPKVIRQLEALQPEFVVPGHGDIGSQATMRGQREFIEKLTTEAENALRNGKQLSDLVEIKDGKVGQSRVVFPDSLKTWVGDSLGQQIEIAYKQLSNREGR